MNCGIYKIVNKKNNKVYVGSSVNLKSREYKHFWMLRKDIHPNIYLQKSYNKNGVEMFEFEIIELCEENDLIFRENHYINYYRSNEMEFGYNLALVGNSRRNIVSAEVKMKLSKHNQNKNGNFSKFSLTNIISEEIFIFDTLIDGANYLIKNGFANGQSKNVRMTISNCLRGVKVNNGHKGSVRKTIYKHLAKVIN